MGAVETEGILKNF